MAIKHLLSSVIKPLLLTWLVLLWHVPNARALDVVLVSDSLRAMNISQSVERPEVDQTEFAIQNTSDEIIAFELQIEGRDVFHQVFLGLELLPEPQSYRLIGSDDQEWPALQGTPLRFRLILQPGEVKRFMLIGAVSQNASFWLWNRHYNKQIEANQQTFRHVLLSVLGVFGFLCLFTAYKFKRKRFVMPSFLALIFALLLHFRWQAEQGAQDLNNLRGLLALAVVYIFIAHRALNRVPWTERRYWRTVILLVDVLIIANISAWFGYYFNPTLFDGFSAEWLEMLLALVAITLCLAVILYLIPSKIKPTPDHS